MKTLNQQQINEGNKLIAEFMIEHKFSFPTSYFKKGFHYHSDWNCLIRVVEKIENTTYKLFPYRFNVDIHSKFVRIHSPLQSEPNIIIFLIKTIDSGLARLEKIETVYLAVIEFINWYNQQTTSTQNDNPEK